MMTPLAAFGLGMLIGGSLSVVFYRRRNPIANITPGAAMLHAWDQIHQKVIELVEQAMARNPDPQAQQAMEFFKTEQGIALLVTSALIGTLVAFVIFSGLGGAIGAALLRRKERF
jgi:hypothetical protein